MIKFYTNRVVSAEQFTRDHIPEGVMVAPDIFIRNVLTKSLQEEIKNKVVWIYKYPQPDESDKKIADLFKVPFPFTWINYGDYVLTNKNGYSRVETQKIFERDYKEIFFKP